MDDNGTYLGNIYEIHKECITNISINIYDIKQSETQNTEAPPSAVPPMGWPPSAAAPSGLSSLFLLIYLFIL